MGSMKVKSHVNTAGGGIKYATNGLRKNFEGGTLSEQVLSTSRRDRPDAIRYDRCKVVVTIGGPLTETVEQLEAMLRAGMTVARFDFTAGSRSLDQHLNTLANLRQAQKNTQCLCAVHCALGGNLFATATKAREDVRLVFVEGQTVRFVHRATACDSSANGGTTAFENTDVIPVGGGKDLERLDFLESFRVGDAVNVRPFLRAGETSAALEVTAVAAGEVTCRCLRGAEMAHAVKRLAVDLVGLKTGPGPGPRLTESEDGEKGRGASGDFSARHRRGASSFSRKDSHSPESLSSRPFAFNASDAAVLERFAKPGGCDFVSVRGVPSAAALTSLRKALRETHGLPLANVVAQVDNVHALRDLPRFIEAADVVLLARGELGAEIAPEKMFAVQKHVLRTCEKIGKPCIVTRLMDSMCFAPRPTRAEATDVANIVLDGADGLLLGLETLEGRFPLKCLETALAIAREADAVYDYESRYKRQMQFINSKLALSAATSRRLSLETRKEALSAAAVQTAFQIDATLIVVFSHTGETTRLVAKYHPACPVLSLSIPTVRGGTVKWTVEGDAEARHQLVYRGVVPALSAPVDLNAAEETASVVHQPGASRTDVEALTKAASLGLIAPGELAVFCQLIAGLSTVKVVQFGGASTSGRLTSSPAPELAGDAIADEQVHPAGGFKRAHVSNHRLGHVGTEPNLVEAAARVAEASKLGRRPPPPPSIAEGAVSRAKPPRVGKSRRSASSASLKSGD